MEYLYSYANETEFVILSDTSNYRNYRCYHLNDPDLYKTRPKLNNIKVSDLDSPKLLLTAPKITYELVKQQLPEYLI